MVGNQNIPQVSDPVDREILIDRIRMAPKKKAEEVYVVFSHNPMSQLVLAKIGRVPSSHDDPVEFDLFTARVSYFISRNFSLASRQTRYNPLYHHRRRDKRSYIIFSFQPFTTSIMILA